jgi:hypothetical protein
MTRAAGLALGFILAGLACGPALASDSSGPMRFLAALYGHYPVAGHTQPFDVLGAAAPTVFHPSLLALIETDQNLAKDGVGALDGDPICDCQDDSGMRFRIASVRAEGFGRATAVVVISSANDAPPNPITIDLARTDAGWRIYDIHSADLPSLRTLLIQSNRDAAKDAGD